MRTSWDGFGIEPVLIEMVTERVRDAVTPGECIEALLPMVMMDDIPLVQVGHESWGMVVDEEQVN